MSRRKSLCGKELRQFRPVVFAVSLYVVRSYVDCVLSRYTQYIMMPLAQYNTMPLAQYNTMPINSNISIPNYKKKAPRSGGHSYLTSFNIACIHETVFGCNITSGSPYSDSIILLQL